MSLLRPPYVKLSWSATSLTTSFGGYKVYRRPSRSPAAEWVLIFDITVPTGYSAATVEAQHTTVYDYEAGWSYATGQWTDGWDYAVAVTNAAYGFDSELSQDRRNTVTADGNAWLVSNAEPFLNAPMEELSARSVSDKTERQVYKVIGRDQQVVRVRSELPSREWSLQWYVEANHEDALRTFRAAAQATAPMCLHTIYGDRLIGSLGDLSGEQVLGSKLTTLVGSMIETTRTSETADYNSPCGLVLDGSADYCTTADSDNLDPSSSAFTVFSYGAFANTATAALSKGNLLGASGQRYGLYRSSSNNFSFVASGASATATCTESSSTWFNGDAHVAVGTSSGTAQVLYRDGTSVATATTTHGSISNANTFVAGADNSGASGFMGIAPLHAWGYYDRALTAAEAQALSYYLLGYPGYRAPGGAVVFYDCRDSRSFAGTAAYVNSLGWYTPSADIISAPPVRGIPWNLAALDVY